MSVINQQENSRLTKNVTFDSAHNEVITVNNQISVINEEESSRVTGNGTGNPTSQSTTSTENVICHHDNAVVKTNDADARNEQMILNNNGGDGQQDNSGNEISNNDREKENNINKWDDSYPLNVIQKYKISLQKRRRTERHSPNTEKKHNIHIGVYNNDTRENFTI